MTFAILLKEKDGREGELIGEGGWTYLSLVGFTSITFFKKEHWGYGYGTEFVRALIEFWWSLPRQDVQLRVPFFSVDLGETPKVTELLLAGVDPDNERSQKVIRKAGFCECGEYSYGGRIVLRYPPFQKKG